MNQIKNAASQAANTKFFELGARVGFVAHGIIHLLIAWLILKMVFGAGDKVDEKGALATIASSTGGVFLLWAIAVSLILLSLWHVVEAILIRGNDFKSKLGKQAKFTAKAAAYLLLGFAAVSFARNTAGGDSKKELTATILALPAGKFLMIAISLIIIAISCYLIYKGATKKYYDDLVVQDSNTPKIVTILGTGGYCSKGVSYFLVGVLVLLGAWRQNSSQAAGGLDSALRDLLNKPFGPYLLFAIALGFIAYGCYLFIKAKYVKFGN